jgi:hypothetical protein
LEGLRTTPVAIDIVVNPAVQFNPVERDRLFAQGDFGEHGAHFRVELVPVHAEIARRIAQADQARQALQAAPRAGHGQAFRDLPVHGGKDESRQSPASSRRPCGAGANK